MHRTGTQARDDSRPRALAALAIAFGLAYLIWRSSTFGSGPTLLLSVPWFIAEIWAFAQLTALSYQAWQLPLPRPGPQESTPPPDLVDVVISAAGAGPAEIERSLVGSASLQGCSRIVVLDASARTEVRSMAQRAGADYVVAPDLPGSTGSVVHAQATSELYLWLEAGQVPMPNLLAETAPRFDDQYLAVCQHAVGLLNADSLVHLRGGRDEEALLRNVIGPGLDRRGTAPWFGPGALIRRRAVNVAGGYESDDAAAVERLLVNLHRRGYSSAFEPNKLIRATAPDTLDDYLTRRRQHGIEALRVFRTPESPLRVRGLSPSQRLTHLTIGLGFARGVRQLLVLAVLCGTLLTGRLPFEASGPTMLASWLLVSTLSLLAHRSLGRDTMAVGDWVRHGWRTAGADLSALCAVLGGAHRTAKARTTVSSGIRALGRLRLLTAAVVVLDLVLMARAATLLEPDLLPAFTTSQRVVVLGVGLLMLLPMIDVLQVVVLRQQRRAHFRLQTSLPIDLNGTSGTTVDLAPVGVGTLLDFAPAIGAVSTFRLELPRVDGTVQTIRGTASVRAANPDPGGQVRVGLEFVNLSDPARVALIEYCAIGHAHLATIDSTPPLMTPGHLTVERHTNHHRSLQVLTGVAVTAGAATLLVGPAAGTALAAGSVVELACVASPIDEPVAGVSIEMSSGSDWTRLGETSASGCLQVDGAMVDTVFAATHEGLRAESNEKLIVGNQVTFRLERHTIRLLDSSGAAVTDAKLRYFTDSWHTATPVAPGEAYFDALTPDVSVEAAVDQERFVVESTSGVTNVVLGRLFADGGVTISEIDRGNGWEPFVDGMEVLPGKLVLRLADESVVKTSALGGHDLLVPSGKLAQLTVPLPPDPTPIVLATPVATVGSTATPVATATAAPTSTPEIKPTVAPTTTSLPQPTPVATAEPAPTSISKPTPPPTATPTPPTKSEAG